MIRWMFNLIIRATKLLLAWSLWIFMDHTDENIATVEGPDQDLLEMIEVLEIQQDTLYKQFKFVVAESQKTTISEKKRMDLQVKAANLNVRIHKINQRIMKLREEL